MGGKRGGGIIFRRSGNKVTVLYSFTNGDDGVVKGCGYSPSARLIRAANGSLFGTTSFGGEGSGGVIFKLTADPNHPNAEWTCQVLYPFVSKGPDAANGYAPFGGLLRAADGTLYGTAQKGGKFGGGVVFAIKGGKSTYKVLYAFAKSGANARKGYGPAGPLVMDGSGALYGTTFFGGGPKGGVIYKIAPPYAESDYKVIHQFSPRTGSNGAELGYQPTQGPLLIQGTDLYGETTLGGCPVDANQTPMCPNPNSLPGGVLFTLKTSGSGYTVLHRFDSGEDLKNGYGPYGGLIRAGGGALYGVTQFGGPQAGGVVFRYLNGTYLCCIVFRPTRRARLDIRRAAGLRSMPRAVWSARPLTVEWAAAA